MKMPVIVILLIISFISGSFGQRRPGQIKLYYSWYDLKSSTKIAANLFTYEFSDTTVSVLHKTQYSTGFEPTVNDLKVFPVTDIDKILFRKKGNKGIATAVGIFSGMK